uniref:Wzz/FepE/Etk N-terminal domain-containing protein n=1 Tax=Serratia marcescens TaxID=615 RepID=UPI0021CCC86D
MSLNNIKNTSRLQSDVGEINLVMLLGVLLDHYKLIVVLTTLFTLAATGYALNTTPVYQANALVQIEQKQANTLLSNLSQMLPDTQPQSAPEITLLRSRMILGKTVDALALQTTVRPDFLPFVGRAYARLRGQSAGRIEVREVALPLNGNESARATLRIINYDQYHLSGEGFELEGRRGVRLEKGGV